MNPHAISDDFERHEAVTQTGTVVMERLYRLVRKGYQPDFDMEFTQSIWLRHPAEKDRWPHRTLILYPHGLLVSIDPKDEPRFEVWEKAEFEAFLRKVPIPTWWERTQHQRARLTAQVVMFALAITFTAVFLQGSMWVLEKLK